MSRRRFSQEQFEAISKARIIQSKACARGDHHWWPKYGWDEESQRKPIAPQYWTTAQRFPMPDWDGESLVCSAHRCNVKGSMKDVSSRTQKRMREIVDGFIENTISSRNSYLAERR